MFSFQHQNGDARGEPSQTHRPNRQMLPGEGRRTPLTWVLLALNAGVFVLVALSSGSINAGILLPINADTLLQWGAMFGPLIANGEYWRLLTAMFLHGSVLHLAFNGLALFIFGRLAEGVYGTYRFAVIYLLSGLAGGVASYAFNQTAVAVGASGAIFGTLGAMAGYFTTHRRAMGEMGQRNLTSLAMVALINLGIGFIFPNIDNWAHMGGLAGGFILGLALAPRYRYETVAVGLGTVRRVVGERRIGGQWLAVPLFLGLLAAAILLIGNTEMSDKQLSVLLTVRASQMLDDGDALGALEQAERAVVLDNRSAKALFLRGKAYAEIGAIEHARADLGAALRLNSLDPMSHQEALILLVRLR